MAQVLYIQASPRGERSYSTAVGDAFVDAYTASHPEDRVDTINLFTEFLPPFDGPALQAKYAILHGQEASAEQSGAWQEVEKVIARFKAADKYLFTVPMWNFNLPYRLKHYIDLIAQPTYTFSFDPEKGYAGLMTGRPACVVYSRGGAYSPGTPGEGMDFQTKYLETLLGFLGFGDITQIIVEPTLAEGPDAAAQAKEQAIQEAQRLARDF